MKKIFVPALLLGVIVPNAVCGATVPPVADEENAYVGGMNGYVICQLCMETAMNLREWILAMGFAGNQCDGEMLSNSSYIEFTDALRESIIYDADALGVPYAAELVNSNMDVFGEEMCRGVPPANSCMFNSMCICAANYYPNIGYYGEDPYGSLDCMACPGGGKSAENSQRGITDCYIPAGTMGTDETGTFTYSANCHYTPD